MIANALGLRKRRGEAGEGVGEGQLSTGSLRCTQPKATRLFRFSGATVVIRDKRRLVFAGRVCSRFQMASDFLVQRLPTASRKALVGSLLHQRVLETVGRFLTAASLSQNQTRCAQLRQSRSELLPSRLGESLEHRIGELASDDGRNLRNILGAPQSIKTRHQRVL